MVEVITIPADGCAGIGALGQVMTRLTGGALVAAAPGAAPAGGVASLTTPAVAPESPGTLRHTQPVAEAHRGHISRRFYYCDNANSWSWHA